MEMILPLLIPNIVIEARRRAAHNPLVNNSENTSAKQPTARRTERRASAKRLIFRE
jgi:hypothetical protein